MTPITATTFTAPASPSATATGPKAAAGDDAPGHAFGRELQRAADAAAPERTRKDAAQARKAADGQRPERPATRAAEARQPADAKRDDEAPAAKGAAPNDGDETATEAETLPVTDATAALPAGLAAFMHRWSAGRADAAASDDTTTADGRIDDAAGAPAGETDLSAAGGEPGHRTARGVADAVHAAAADRPQRAQHGAGTPFGHEIAAAAHDAAQAALDERRAAIDLPLAELPQAPTLPAAASDAALAALAARGPTAAAAGSADPAAGSNPAPAATHTLAPSLESREFAPALGARIAVFARDGIEQAQLNIHPADMGPIGVKLVLDGTQVRVDLTAEVGATRQWLEQALPALAGALQDAGFTLSGGGVFQPPRGDTGDANPGRGGGERGEPSLGRQADTGTADTTALPVARAMRHDGLVDFYA